MEDEIDDFETVVKVIVIGDGRVGKSSMTQRYCRGVYTDAYKKTIGVDFMEKQIELEDLGEEVKLMIWDTAGQEEFDSLTKGYYKGAGAVVLVFSTIDRESFDRIPKWLSKAQTECGKVPMALVENKCDLMDSSAVVPDEVEALAKKYGLRLYRTSVKDNVNVKEVFEYLTAKYIELQDQGELGEPAVDVIGQHNQATMEEHEGAKEEEKIEEVGYDEEPMTSSQKEHSIQENKHEEEKLSSSKDVSPERTGASDEGKTQSSKVEEKPREPSRQPINQRNKAKKDIDENIKRNLPPPKPKASQQAFKLTPSKQRTGGKKKTSCSLL